MKERINGEEFDINIVDYNILIEFNSDATHSLEEDRIKDKLKHRIAKELNKELLIVMQQCYKEFDNTLYYDILFNTDKRNYLEDLIEELKIKLREYGLNIENNISKEAKALANKNAVPFERSLLGVYPDIKDIWSDKNEVGPELIFAKSRRYIYLKCNKHNNEYSIRADSLKTMYNTSKGCPLCKSNKATRGVTDLLTIEPELCRDWDEANEIKPYEVTAHSKKKVMWKCRFCGYRWKEVIKRRVGISGYTCPNCNSIEIKDSDIPGPDDF